LIGTNAFQVRRVPIQIGFFDDEMWKKVSKRPLLTRADFEVVRQHCRRAGDRAHVGVSTPLSDLQWRNRVVGDVQIRGVTAPYQVVQDYTFERGRPLMDVDEEQRRAVAVIGSEVAEKLFESTDPIGQEIRLAGDRFEVVGVMASKGRVLGQSFDAIALIPLSRYELLYGHRATTSISVKMADAGNVASGMQRAEEAMRLARRLRPGQENNFSVETA
jgi:putative ABC transport system permease protein